MSPWSMSTKGGHRAGIFLLVVAIISYNSLLSGSLPYLQLRFYTTDKKLENALSEGVSVAADPKSERRVVNDNYMRSCVMIRNDNHRLFEWVAYHYTVLPLRYIIVGSDVNSTEDPMEVLSRWNGTDLKFQVWYADDFLQNYKSFTPYPIRKLAERQAHFYLRCMQYFQTEGNLGWLTMTDTDEYIKLNPLDDKKDEKYFKEGQPKIDQIDNQTIMSHYRFLGNETLWDRVLERKRLRGVLGLDSMQAGAAQNVGLIPTVVDVLENYSSRLSVKPCFTMARLQHTAVTENVTAIASSKCSPRIDPIIASSLNVTELTTMRYFYHWDVDNFHKSRWGKVMVDLRRIPPESVLTAKRYHNPHAPISECGRPPGVTDLESFIRVNHYLNDFNVYIGRNGDPRGKDGRSKSWAEFGHGRDEVTCGHMAAWLNEFVQHFGMERAKYMLGKEQEIL